MTAEEKILALKQIAQFVTENMTMDRLTLGQSLLAALEDDPANFPAMFAELTAAHDNP